MTTTSWFAIGVLCLVATTAHAAPVLEPVDAGAFTVSVPKGWTVQHDGGVVMAHRDPARKDAAALLFTMQPATPDEQVLLDALAAQVATGLAVRRREAAHGGHVLVADGVADGYAVRLAAMAVTIDEVVVICVVVAKPPELEALGGLALVTAVMASVKASGVAPAGPSATPRAPTGRVDVPPPPAHAIAIADLAGEWKHDDGVMSHYVSSTTGEYAGYSAISVSETWTITAAGAISIDMWATTASRSGARQTHETRTGSVTLAPDGTLALTIQGRPSKYLLRGWLAGPELVVMKLNGVYYDDIPADIRADPHKGPNLDQYWVRKAKR